MNHKPLPLGSLIFMALLGAGVFWLCYSFIRFRPDDVSDYSTVTGTLVSAEEQITSRKGGRSGHLEIRLLESAVRYCIPADGYVDYFRREAFFAEVSKGDSVQLTALASEIASPSTFILNSTPTVFVRGVRVDNRDYCTVQDHILWQKSNNRSKLGIAVAGTGFIAFIYIRSRRRKKADAT